MQPFSFVTPTCSADGYGCSGEQLALAAVRDHGARISITAYDWRDDRFSDAEFLAMVRPTDRFVPHEHDVCVVYFLPYALPRFRGRERTVCQTMWETDRMPNAWASMVQAYADAMIVPSEHCRSVFADRVDKPIEVVPYGTDTDVYAYHDRERVPGESFVFLMAGLLHYRKGVDFALRAFVEEFDPSEPVRLWLKTRLTFLDPVDQRQALGDPRVLIIDDDFTREQMCEMYWDADCLLAPSRGEGSGLTPRDAMATGLPVILHDWSGLAELADPRYTYVVPTDALEPAPHENTSYGTGVTGGGDIGNFARPSIEALRAHMRDVYENREQSLERGHRAADWMRRRWTWERCSYQWLQAVDALSAVVA